MEHPDLANEVMQTIKEKNISMKPKLYFIAGTLLLAVGIGLLLLIATLFTTFASQHLRSVGPFGYLLFGEYGISAFIRTFPWMQFTIALVTVFIGVRLLKTYDFSYRHNYLAIATAIVLGVFFSGYMLDQVGLNETIRETPIAKPFVRHQYHEDKWLVGEVIEVQVSFTQSTQREMIIKTPDGAEIRVVWDHKTLLPYGGTFAPNERIRIVGEWRGDYFYAVGIGRGGLHWRKISVLPLPYGTTIIYLQ